MDTETIARVQKAVLTQSGKELVEALAETIGKGHERLTVRYAKDQLSAVLKRARSGEPQFIGDDPEEQTVIISVADLAALCQASAKTLTFGEALARVGFQPQRMPESARLEIRQRPRRREKLPIHKRAWL
jgi:hypothetical protein